MTITRVDPIVYKAAAEGNIMTFSDDNFNHRLEAILTPNKNTILHIFITTLQNEEELAKMNFVREILNMCPSLLCQVNVKDETPLHVAARYGHANIVRVLIENARDSYHPDLGSGTEAVKKMLRMVNRERDTALHEAVRYNHLEVMELLINEDRDFAYSVNDAGETPLYIAAERNYENLVLVILNSCNSPAYDGPIGRTALHAAVLWDNEVTIEKILERIGGAISEKTDEKGWTPLHLAAHSHRWSSTKILLKHDSQVAYMKDREGRTALHIAAHRSSYRIMETIIDMCPDCCELVDNRGRNALHFAVWTGYYRRRIMQQILENSSLSDLLNEKDAEGNTPLHYQYSRSFEYGEDLTHHPRVDKMAFNNNNRSAYQVALTRTNLTEEKMREIEEKVVSNPRRVLLTEAEDYHISIAEFWKNEKKKWEARQKEYLEKSAQAHLVVAALITTVTFAAAITMPGGFVSGGNHQGSAVLRRNAAFKVFIITDAISLVLSSSAVVIHLLMPLLFKHSKLDETRDEFLKLAFLFILLAMGAMVLAFITGAYAALAHSLDLAVTTCVIGSWFFLILFFICRMYREDLGLDAYISLVLMLCWRSPS